MEAAHAGAKEALVELRDLSSGIHPPVLDNGLGPALENLAAGSAIPVRVTANLMERPSPAIETIAYFSAAELLANAVKHSSANVIEVAATVTAWRAVRADRQRRRPGRRRRGGRLGAFWPAPPGAHR